MQSAHDLGTAPSLVDAQVADDVGRLHATVGAVTREQRGAIADRTDVTTRIDGAAASSPDAVLVDDLRGAARFR